MDNTPDDIPELYDIESLEQLRAMADELRLRILDHLAHAPLTVTQLGERLGVAPAKAHYHVRELERVGLVRLVATRENRGILEKYYRAAGRGLRIPDGLIQRLPADEAVATCKQLLDNLTSGYLAAMERKLRDGRETSGSQLISGSIWLTDDEVRELTERVGELINPYDHPRGVPGERERIFSQISYPLALPTTGDETDEQPAEPARAGSQSTRTTHHRRQRAIAAGVLSYSRADLERRLARGHQLDIYALGAVVFADDVTPELAERAIGRFHLKGKLTAPPGVREVLKRIEQKEQEE